MNFLSTRSSNSFMAFGLEIFLLSTEWEIISVWIDFLVCGAIDFNDVESFLGDRVDAFAIFLNSWITVGWSEPSVFFIWDATFVEGFPDDIDSRLEKTDESFLFLGASRVIHFSLLEGVFGTFTGGDGVLPKPPRSVERCLTLFFWTFDLWYLILWASGPITGIFLRGEGLLVGGLEIGFIFFIGVFGRGGGEGLNEGIFFFL